MTNVATILMADVDSQELNAKWERLLAQVDAASGSERVVARHRAVAWMLVQIFGTDMKYVYEPTFHAQVQLAAQTMEMLAERERRKALSR